MGLGGCPSSGDGAARDGKGPTGEEARRVVWGGGGRRGKEAKRLRLDGCGGVALRGADFIAER